MAKANFKDKANHLRLIRKKNRKDRLRNRKFLKKVLTDSPKSAILKLPKERKTTAESATVNLLGFQEKKELEQKNKKSFKKGFTSWLKRCIMKSQRDKKGKR